MSALIINNAKDRFAASVYKHELKMLYGINAGKTNLWRLYNIKMMLDVLEWNDTANYLTDDERDCLIGKLNHNLKTCKC